MDKELILKNTKLIKNAYVAFNAKSIDALLNIMHPNVKWAKAWEGDYANGHNELSTYWQRQWMEIDPEVTPVGFRETKNGALEVDVDQLVKYLDGKTLFNGKVKHVYTIHEGLVQQMDIVLN
jgi:hypothetical protein